MKDWRTYLSQSYRNIDTNLRFFRDYHKYQFSTTNKKIMGMIYHNSTEYIETSMLKGGKITPKI